MDIAISSILAPIISILAYKSAYPDWTTATCEHYARNAYLYTLAMLVIYWMLLALFNQTKLGSTFMLQLYSSWLYIILYILLLIIIMTIVQFTDPRNVFMKHFTLLIFIIIFALATVPAYVLYQPVLIIALAIAILIGFITYQLIMTYPSMMTQERANNISIAFIIAFIAYIVFVVFIIPSIIIKYPAIIYFGILLFSIGFAVIFSLRMMVHHHEIVEHSKVCNMSNHLPDYVNEALGVFITFVNLIIEIARILFLTRRR